MSNYSTVEVMSKLSKANFTSEYTNFENDIFKVDEDKLFNDLSQEEKISFSFKEDKYYCLNIWEKTWMYIEELDQWVLISQYNTWRAEHSWNPYYVSINNDYILDVANEQLYKKV
jgi:hypothetical protein